MEREGEALAQAKQSANMVNIAIGQYDRRYRTRAEAATHLGPQLGRHGNLLAQVRRSVEKCPTSPVSTHGQGRLGARLQARHVAAHIGAVPAVAVGLRKSTARGRSEHLDDHGGVRRTRQSAFT
jgi:hypothetical protein